MIYIIHDNKYLSDYHFLSAMLILCLPKTTLSIYGGIGMAKKLIQFQKGISIPEFMDNYGTEQKCHDTLFNSMFKFFSQAPLLV